MPSPQDVRKTLKDVVGVVKVAVEKVKKHFGSIPEGDEKVALVKALDDLGWAITVLEHALVAGGLIDVKLEHMQGLLDTANGTINGAKSMATNSLAKIALNGAQTTIALQAMRVARVATPTKEG